MYEHITRQLCMLWLSLNYSLFGKKVNNDICTLIIYQNAIIFFKCLLELRSAQNI